MKYTVTLVTLVEIVSEHYIEADSEDEAREATFDFDYRDGREVDREEIEFSIESVRKH